MTYERMAIEALDRATMLPGSWEKRFARSLAATAENTVLSPKQREWLWKLTKKYRRQIPPVAVKEALRWLALSEEEKGFRHGLIANTNDFGLRLVFADWLLERGDERRECAQRFIAARNLAPTLEPCGMSYGSKGDTPMNYEWKWPYDLWREFSPVASDHDYLGTWHHSQEEAENGLAKALDARARAMETTHA